MRFIPKASLKASSQITASSNILDCQTERHLDYEYELIIQSPWPLPLLGRWLANKLTVLLGGGGGVETAWPHSLYWHPVNTKHLYDFMQCWTNVEDVEPTLTLYKCLVFAGQEDFLSNIVHLSNVGSMLGQRCRHWPNIKTAMDQCLVWVVSCNQFSGYINVVKLYSICYCWPTLDHPRHAHFAVEWFFKGSG